MVGGTGTVRSINKYLKGRRRENYDGLLVSVYLPDKFLWLPVNGIAGSLGMINGNILSIGRASAYKLATSGLFKTIRIGNMIRVSRKSFEDWLKMEGLDDETE